MPNSNKPTMKRMTQIPLAEGKTAEKIMFDPPDAGGASGTTIAGVLVEPTTEGVRITALDKNGKERKQYMRIPKNSTTELVVAIARAAQQVEGSLV